MTLPAISIIIPTFNRAEQLALVLAGIESQDAPIGAIEIVVVSDGSTDGTVALLGAHSSRWAFRFVDQPNGGPASARNTGLHMASAPLVLFIDDDVVPTPSLVRHHLEAHERLGADAVVIGPMEVPPDADLQPWIAWEQAMLTKQYDAMTAGEWSATARQFYTGNASLSRALALEAGGFDSKFRRAEDVEFAFRLERAGARFEYEARAVGLHYARRPYASWLSNAAAYGQSDVIFARDHGQRGLLEGMHEKFARHHSLVRWSTLAALRWRPLVRPLVASLSAIARVAGRVGAQRVGRAALSGAYNVTYYVAAADEYGSPRRFLRLLEGREPHPLAPRVGFVLEQSLGHVTHGKNLRSLVPAHPAIAAEFADIPYEPSGWAALFGPYRSNWTVRSGLLAGRAIRRMRRGDPLDALFIHTQVPAVLSARWVRRIRTVVSLDATPMQYDELGDAYGHESGGAAVERLKWRLNRRVLRRARQVVTWSDWAKQGVVDGYGIDASKITVIPPGVDPAQWRRVSPRPAETDVVRLLLVGGDLQRKGGDTLIEAFGAYRAQATARPVELHLVTKTAVDPAPGIVVHDSLGPNSPELIALYHRCDVFVLPTRGDCLPMVLSEAGAAGMPLVSTDIGAIAEIVVDQQTGFLVPVDDVEALVVAIGRLVEDDALRSEMGARAEALVAQRFDAAVNAGRLVELLARVARS